MNDDTSLTADIANQFIAGKLTVSTYGTLTEDAAEIIGSSSHTGTLNLRGLRELDANVARKLSQTKARYLELDGLTSLTDELAEALSAYEGRLSLDGIQHLSDAQCEFLSRNRGGLLLNGVRSVSDAGAASFGRHSGPLLLGVRKLSDSQAQILAAHKAALRLAFLRDLDVSDGGRALADRMVKCPDFGVNTLELNELKTLQHEIADILRKYRGLLYLDAIDSLDEASANALSKHKGYALSLNGLHHVDANVAKALGKYKGRLRLGVDSLTDDEAKALSSYKGQCLVLSSLDSLTDQAADHFSRCPAAISFAGVKRLSVTAASKFLSHKGPLYFDLSGLPEDVQAILRKHKSLKSQAPSLS
jgi:hypothetical protein